jgi:hypothetical protein
MALFTTYLVDQTWMPITVFPVFTVSYILLSILGYSHFIVARAPVIQHFIAWTTAAVVGVFIGLLSRVLLR